MGCGCEKKAMSDDLKKVLQAMTKCAGPCGSKDIAAATGLDAKVVSCKITDLKKKGYIDSPERCKYGITEEGRAALKG
jgi:predicted transcriptional regulator